MQINLQESGTYLFISDHCHVIENVSCFESVVRQALADVTSGVMVFHRDGLREIIQHGSALLND